MSEDLVKRAVRHLEESPSPLRGPDALIAEMSDEILRLRGAKSAALKLADERAIEAVELRAKFEGCKEMFAHTAERANEYVKAFQQQEGKLASARKAFDFIRSHLISHLDEPQRSAFWKAVEMRDALTDEKGQS